VVFIYVVAACYLGHLRFFCLVDSLRISLRAAWIKLPIWAVYDACQLNSVHPILRSSESCTGQHELSSYRTRTLLPYGIP